MGNESKVAKQMNAGTLAEREKALRAAQTKLIGAKSVLSKAEKAHAEAETQYDEARLLFQKEVAAITEATKVARS